MNAIATRPARKPYKLTFEEISQGKPDRIDREAGIIYGVRVIGPISQNGRRYTPEALQKAIPLYEGRSVRIDHPRKPDDSRPVTSIFGRLVNVRIDEDQGLRADLEFIKSHELAEFLCEAAERMPEQVGLSHNAVGDGETVDGIFVVREIVEVRSVDIVADPATTRGLFEEKQPRKPMKRSAYFDKVSSKFPADRIPIVQSQIKQLMENGAMCAEDDMPADLVTDDGEEPASSDPNDALRDGIESSIHAVVSSCLAGEDDVANCMKKIKELLNAHYKLSGQQEDEEPVEEEDEKKDDEAKGDDEEKPVKEEEVEEEDDEKKKDEGDMESKQLKASNAALTAILEASGVKVPAALVKALANLDTDEERKAVLESVKASITPVARKTPVSQTPGKNVTEGVNANGVPTADSAPELIHAFLQS